jgi:polyisoprenoid-binding protein YceI
MRPGSLKRGSAFWVLATLVSALAVNAQAAGWKVDPSHSTLGFSGTQSGSPFDGHFVRYDARIVFDPNDLSTACIGVTVDTSSATSANPQRDNAMPGKDWFDVADFPHAQFETRSIQRASTGGYEARGTLTIRGVTRAVVVPLTVNINGDTAHLKGHLQVNRTDYGIGQGPWSNPQWVGVLVNVDFDLMAHRTG